MQFDELDRLVCGLAEHTLKEVDILRSALDYAILCEGEKLGKDKPDEVRREAWRKLRRICELDKKLEAIEAAINTSREREALEE